MYDDRVEDTRLTGTGIKHTRSSRITGWGRYPDVVAQLHTPSSHAALLKNGPGAGFNGIARGQGRSYGDSALARQLLCTSKADAILSLDEDNGLLHCAAGTTLAELLRLLVPRGWFLPVVPGTAHVSVGGAIASDIHGKNHHIDGCFSEHVQSLTLLDGDGNTHLCSPDKNTDLFQTTCGGMGLTGIITSAVLNLRRINSPCIQQQTLRTRNLEETFHFLDTRRDSHYSVAWLDCMARGSDMGRSLVLLGEHADGPTTAARASMKTRLAVPVTTPGWLLNRYSMRVFNSLYYHFPRSTEARVLWQPFFFPLDSIGHWNRLYGRRGFLQYQFVLPPETALDGMKDILGRIATAGKGSFLSVLKRLGPANNKLLSFPVDGYTLALDFRYQPSLLPLLDELDERVIDYGGRLYLSKDARMSRETFRSGYPQWQHFAELRQAMGAHRHFNSLQSQRLGI